ncbi:hypothetical protein P261_02899 [Lachnospiraceae bacterium TWA4]|nr:hypothetical protein P261_02899 [Lachnospiraceae bacterium TWA4]
MRNFVKKSIAFCVIVGTLICCILGCCHKFYQEQGFQSTAEISDEDTDTSHLEIKDTKKDSTVQEKNFINSDGKTLESRIQVPNAYKRVSVKAGSLGEFLRTYEMKPDKSPVLLYNGLKKGNQSDHVAVFTLPIENRNLQQCADSIMRIYGEYYYHKKEYKKINFILGGGFVAKFDKWKSGYGIGVSGDRLKWISKPKNDSSYESFKKFMQIVFAYSGTLNMEDDSKKISEKQMQIGDIFLKGGSPGHVVMVVDMCTNEKGEKAFLLAQGYMPAQEFHVIKNPLHKDDPWYYVSELSYPFKTAEYTFDEGSLKRYELFEKS